MKEFFPGWRCGLLLCFCSAFAQAFAGLPTEPLGPSSRRTGVVFSEIHYHPVARSDARNLEFVELYNSNPFIEDISNWRLAGDIQFTFPTNTVLAPNSFLVVAGAPGDLTGVYGVTNVVGPFVGNLPNKLGHLQLLKKSGGIVLDLTYADQAPWPLAADGYGPSMALVRPTLGEADGRAWAASARAGGSPGVAEPFVDRITPSRLHIVPNGVAAGKSRRRQPPPWRIGIIGRVAPENGQVEFLRAAKWLAQRRADLRFVICGAPLFSNPAAQD
ncbi:MAG: lamin tail domain-containing protein, partial [Verrucomicrobia bacterium]|nr:lamin tail domain-containing protein [Verrucomicrobiota bacterium]